MVANLRMPEYMYYMRINQQLNGEKKMSQETPLNSEGVVSTNSEGKRIWMSRARYFSNANKEYCRKLTKARRRADGYLILPTNEAVITIDRMTSNSKDIFLGQVNVGYIYKYNTSSTYYAVTTHYEVALYSPKELVGEHGTFTVPTLRKRFSCNQHLRSSEWNREENPNNEHNTPRAALKLAVEFAKEHLRSLMPTAAPEPPQAETVSKGILEGWTQQKGEDVTLITSPDQLVMLQWHSLPGYEDYFTLKVWSEEEEKYVVHSRPDAWRAAHREALSLYTPEAVAFSKEEAEDLFQEWGKLDYHGQMLNIPKIVTDIGYQTEYTPEDQAVLDSWNEYKKEHVKPAPIRVIRRMMEEKQLAKVHDVRRAFDAYSMAMNGTERMSASSATVQRALRDEWLKEQARSEAILECLTVIYQNDI